MSITKTVFVSCDQGAGLCDTTAEETAQHGLVFRGQGSGFLGYSTPNYNPLAGTTLRWDGPLGGTVLRIANTASSVFEDFAIVGSVITPTSYPDGAGIGIEYTADNAKGASQQSIFRNITIHNVQGTPGIGFRVAPESGPEGSPTPKNDQISETVFENMEIRWTKTAVYQGGQQSTNLTWRNNTLLYFRDYGMDLRAPEVHVQGCAFLTNESTSKADVRVGVGQTGTSWRSTFALFQDNYHETYFGSAYLFCDGNNCGDGSALGNIRIEPTTLMNVYVNWWQNDPGGLTPVIDYRHKGPLNLIGCTFKVDTAGGFDREGIVKITPPAGTSPMITSLGNFWANFSPTKRVRMTLSGTASLSSNDDPLQLGAPTNSTGAYSYRNAGMIFESGSFNWQPLGGGSTTFREYLNPSSQLALVTGSNLPLAAWTTTGELKLQAASPKLSFGATSVVPANPATIATVTVPAATGTLALVPGANQQVAFNNSGALGGSANLTFNSATGLLASKGLACTSSPCDLGSMATPFAALHSGLVKVTNGALTSTLDATAVTTNRSVKLPNTDGMVVTSATPSTGAGVALRCGAVTMNPSSTAKDVKVVVTATVSGLAVGDVCTCSTSANWSTLASQSCYGSAANTMTWVLVNAGAATFDAPASTVDYCCFRK